MSDQPYLPSPDAIHVQNFALRGGVGPMEDGTVGCAMSFMFKLEDGTVLPECVIFLPATGLLKLAEMVSNEVSATLRMAMDYSERQKREKAAES